MGEGVWGWDGTMSGGAREERLQFKLLPPTIHLFGGDPDLHFSFGDMCQHLRTPWALQKKGAFSPVFAFRADKKVMPRGLTFEFTAV